MTHPSSVTVVVLTYRRPDDLAAALPPIVRQVRELDLPAEILVVDNDPEASAATMVATFEDAQVSYVHEPTPGIAAARNRALDTVRTELLVFIDDDERPAEGWLRAIVGLWQEHRPAGVVGPVVSELGPAPDPWIVAGGFFQRRQLVSGTEVKVAATNNLLLDLTQVRRLQLRFDERFGLTGGSDNLFTRQLTGRGGRLVWCAEASVVDVVPPSRLTRRWVIQRSYRMGNGTALVELELANNRRQRVRAQAKCVGSGGARVAGGVIRVAGGALTGSVTRRANGVRNLARGSGLITGAFGFAFAEYQRKVTADPRPDSPAGPDTGRDLAGAVSSSPTEPAQRTAPTDPGERRMKDTTVTQRAYSVGLRAYRQYRLFSSPERVRMRSTVRRWIRGCTDGGYVLEIGGGTSMLRPVIEREVRGAHYISGDIAPTNNTTAAMDGNALPVATGSIDAVIALEVLEHLPNPQRMLTEASRILKPGGMLIVTTPFMFGVHDYRDYFRYTPLGLTELLAGSGLTLSSVVLRGGTFVSALGLIRNLMRDAIVGQPGDWRAGASRKKVLWAIATVVMTPWTPVMWLALGLDRVVDRNSKSSPGYFFLCHKTPSAAVT